jgi:hypothetical protein
MNTTSHEYIACQQENKGALILSEFTGSAGSFSGAFLVNPWDHLGVANALNDSLSMPKEELAVKHKHLYNYVQRHTAAFWSQSFIKELHIKSARHDQSIVTPELDVDKVLMSYSNAKKRLLLFDYDVTNVVKDRAHLHLLSAFHLPLSHLQICFKL